MEYKINVGSVWTDTNSNKFTVVAVTAAGPKVCWVEYRNSTGASYTCYAGAFASRFSEVLQ